MGYNAFLNHTHVTLPMPQQIFATQNFKPETNTKKIQIFERHKVHLPRQYLYTSLYMCVIYTSIYILHRRRRCIQHFIKCYVFFTEMYFYPMKVELQISFEDTAES